MSQLAKQPAERRHRIDRLEFDFAFHQDQPGIRDADDLAWQVRNELLIAVDEVLENNFTDTSFLKIDHLELDLGQHPSGIDWPQLRVELTTQLSARLSEYLGRPVVAPQLRDLQSDFEHADPKQIFEDKTRSGGSNGRLNWLLSVSDPAARVAYLSRLKHTDPTAFQQIAYELARDEDLARRAFQDVFQQEQLDLLWRIFIENPAPGDLKPEHVFEALKSRFAGDANASSLGGDLPASPDEPFDAVELLAWLNEVAADARQTRLKAESTLNLSLLLVAALSSRAEANVLEEVTGEFRKRMATTGNSGLNQDGSASDRIVSFTSKRTSLNATPSSGQHKPRVASRTAASKALLSFWRQDPVALSRALSRFGAVNLLDAIGISSSQDGDSSKTHPPTNAQDSFGTDGADPSKPLDQSEDSDDQKTAVDRLLRQLMRVGSSPQIGIAADVDRTEQSRSGVQSGTAQFDDTSPAAHKTAHAGSKPDTDAGPKPDPAEHISGSLGVYDGSGEVPSSLTPSFDDQFTGKPERQAGQEPKISQLRPERSVSERSNQSLADNFNFEADSFAQLIAEWHASAPALEAFLAARSATSLAEFASQLETHLIGHPLPQFGPAEDAVEKLKDWFANVALHGPSGVIRPHRVAALMQDWLGPASSLKAADFQTRDLAKIAMHLELLAGMFESSRQNGGTDEVSIVLPPIYHNAPDGVAPQEVSPDRKPPVPQFVRHEMSDSKIASDVRPSTHAANSHPGTPNSQDQHSAFADRLRDWETALGRLEPSKRRDWLLSLAETALLSQGSVEGEESERRDYSEQPRDLHDIRLKDFVERLLAVWPYAKIANSIATLVAQSAGFGPVKLLREMSQRAESSSESRPNGIESDDPRANLAGSNNPAGHSENSNVDGYWNSVITRWLKDPKLFALFDNLLPERALASLALVSTTETNTNDLVSISADGKRSASSIGAEFLGKLREIFGSKRQPNNNVVGKSADAVLTKSVGEGADDLLGQIEEYSKSAGSNDPEPFLSTLKSAATRATRPNLVLSAVLATLQRGDAVDLAKIVSEVERSGDGAGVIVPGKFDEAAALDNLHTDLSESHVSDGLITGATSENVSDEPGGQPEHQASRDQREAGREARLSHGQDVGRDQTDSVGSNFIDGEERLHRDEPAEGAPPQAGLNAYDGAPMLPGETEIENLNPENDRGTTPDPGLDHPRTSEISALVDSLSPQFDWIATGDSDSNAPMPIADVLDDDRIVDVALILALATSEAGAFSGALASPDRGLARATRISELLAEAERSALLRSISPGVSASEIAIIDLLWHMLPTEVLHRDLHDATKFQFLVLAAHGDLGRWGGVTGLAEKALLWLARRSASVQDIARSILAAPELAIKSADGAAKAQLSTALRRIPGVVSDTRPMNEGTAQDTSLTNSAGLVVLNPYLPILFDRIGLTSGSSFRNMDALETALDALHFIAFGDVEGSDAPRPLERLLTGLEPEIPIRIAAPLSDDNRDLTEGLLKAVCQQWTPLKNTTIEGLRSSFLRRDGIIEDKGDLIGLKVEPKPFDMLLDKLPWTMGVVKYHWMAKPLHVEWRVSNG